MRNNFFNWLCLLVWLNGFTWARAQGVPPKSTETPQTVSASFTDFVNYRLAEQLSQNRYGIRLQKINRRDFLKVEGNLKTAYQREFIFFKQNGRKELTERQQMLINQILDNNSPILDPVAQALAPKFYVIKRGDTLWGIASKVLRNPYKWPLLLRKEDNTPLSNPDEITPGQKLVIYPDVDINQDADAVHFASQYKEKSYQDSEYSKDYPENRWDPNSPKGADGERQVLTGDGRIYVLGKDGQTVYGYDTNSKPLCQISIQDGAGDTFRGAAISYKSGSTAGGTLVFIDNFGNVREAGIPMPPNFTPQPIPTPDIRTIYVTFKPGLSDKEIDLKIGNYGKYTRLSIPQQDTYCFSVTNYGEEDKYNSAVSKNLNMVPLSGGSNFIVDKLKKDSQVQYVGYLKPSDSK